jgi:hypothetical protein
MAVVVVGMLILANLDWYDPWIKIINKVTFENSCAAVCLEPGVIDSGLRHFPAASPPYGENKLLFGDQLQPVNQKGRLIEGAQPSARQIPFFFMAKRSPMHGTAASPSRRDPAVGGQGPPRRCERLSYHQGSGPHISQSMADSAFKAAAVACSRAICFSTARAWKFW